MTKQLSLGVFEMMCPNNGMPTWTDPRGRGERWDDLAYWVDLARLLDGAGFDYLFFADTYGYPTVHGRLPPEVAAHSIQFPGLDPMLAVSAMAAATTSLGFVVSSSTTVERPYALARRFASLDRFTGGRIGWNIVTGSSQVTTDALFGLAEPVGHDERYELAEEFVELCLRFWEGSWEDDAEVRDPAANVYADPARLHAVQHRGARLAAAGTFAVAPTPQRTPTLFQAGTSARGRAFAARHAEAVLIQGTSVEATAAHVADLRRRATAEGRRPDDVAVITSMTVTVAPTRAEAAELRAELDHCYDRRDAAVLFAGFTGVDLGGLDPETPLAGVRSEQGRTLLEKFAGAGAEGNGAAAGPGAAGDGRPPTVGDVLDRFLHQGIRGFLVTGDPDEVAGEIAGIAAATGVDGVMLEPTFGGPDAFASFAELVVPRLRARGLLRDPSASAPTGADGATGPATPAGPATLRERVTRGASARLADRHPGARFRPRPRRSPCAPQPSTR